MSERTHQVGRFHYALDISHDGLGRLELWDRAGGKVCEVACVRDGAALPVPRLAPDLSYACAFVHAASMPALVDLLRHGGEVVVRMDNAPPGFVTFETGRELAE